MTTTTKVNEWTNATLRQGKSVRVILSVDIINFLTKTKN